jgi:S-adenosylmethionine-diacylglycerol 3-amino-3-carboxypropyl transferase
MPSLWTSVTRNKPAPPMCDAESQVVACSTLLHRVAFDFIRYANCWEDADTLCEALQPEPGARVLSISSAGDNTLALLAEGAEVVAADLSRPQLACLELRAAAFRQLSYPEVLSFLGVHPADDRLSCYRRLAADLSRPAQQFWDEQPQAVAVGIIHAGKLEAYFRLFRRWILPLIHSQRTIRSLLAPKNVHKRREFWSAKWNNRRWRLLFRVFFGRRMMGRLGRDPEFFRFVEGDVSEHFMRRARHGLTELPTDCNPFLDYIVTGNFTRALPRYLRPEHYEKIRAGLRRLSIFHGSIEQAGQEFQAGGFDSFNLSDIFEYLDAARSRRLYADLLDLARPRARLAYWNTLVPRGCPAELANRVRPLSELSQELHGRDLVFFYRSFQVDEVRE